MELRLNLTIHKLEELAGDSQPVTNDDWLENANPDLLKHFSKSEDDETELDQRINQLEGASNERTFEVNSLSFKFHEGDYYATNGNQQIPLQDGDCLIYIDNIVQVHISNDSQMSDIDSRYNLQDNYHNQAEDISQHDFMLPGKDKEQAHYQDIDDILGDLNIHSSMGQAPRTIPSKNHDPIPEHLQNHFELPRPNPALNHNHDMQADIQYYHQPKREISHTESGNILNELGIREQEGDFLTYDDGHRGNHGVHSNAGILDEIYEDTRQPYYDERAIGISSNTQEANREPLVQALGKTKVIHGLKTVKKTLFG